MYLWTKRKFETGTEGNAVERSSRTAATPTSGVCPGKAGGQNANRKNRQHIQIPTNTPKHTNRH